MKIAQDVSANLAESRTVHKAPKLEGELTLTQRIISASFGAMLTSLLVTPLEVVKTRLQAQVPVQQIECVDARSPAQCPKCTHYTFHNGLMDVMLPKSLNPQTFECRQHFTGTIDAMYKIAKFEGVAALYNGLRPSLIMAVPSTVPYFALYDKLRDYLVEERGMDPHLAPLVAGSSARTISATAVAPLELVRTKIQAMNNPPSITHLAVNQVRNEGFMSLWRGLWPTLLRDVPFSAIYWTSVEWSKDLIRPYVVQYLRQHSATYATAIDNEETSSLEEFGVSFFAGACGGMIAATFTNPFDVVKTRRQVFQYSADATDAINQQSNAREIMKRIWVREGASGFFVGLTPRLAKIMPACAIMLSSYEAGKRIFLNTTSSVPE